VKRVLRGLALLVIVSAGSFYIVTSIARSSPEKTPSEAPIVSEAPARVYGSVEPRGGEVYVNPPMTRQVTAIFVTEGDTVHQGQVLCSLENSVEAAELAAARADVAVARQALAISREERTRNAALYESNSISDSEFTLSRQKAELDSLAVEAARKRADLAQAGLQQLELTAPIDGIVYKLDVRLGSSLRSDEAPRIILGEAELWVRLYVEAFWANRVHVGDTYEIKDAETGEVLGTGTVIRKLPYLAGKAITTNDLYERFDTKYQEVILDLSTDRTDIPLGLSVMAELPPPNQRFKSR
jgi:multidrug efflux pump subunit AcrA (membrane-fusion protein)